MASGFDVVRLDLAFGRDKLDEWLVAEVDREQFAKLSIAPAKLGKPSTVDAMLAAVEAAAEKRGAADDREIADDEDEEDPDDGPVVAGPYEHFKMKIVGDKLTAEGNLHGDEKGSEAFALAAVTAKAAEMGGKGELVLLGAKGADGQIRNLRIVVQKGSWSEVALSAADAARLRG